MNKSELEKRINRRARNARLFDDVACLTLGISAIVAVVSIAYLLGVI